MKKLPSIQHFIQLITYILYRKIQNESIELQKNKDEYKRQLENAENVKKKIEACFKAYNNFAKKLKKNYQLSTKNEILGLFTYFENKLLAELFFQRQSKLCKNEKTSLYICEECLIKPS